jgi:hypothetical protein
MLMLHEQFAYPYCICLSTQASVQTRDAEAARVRLRRDREGVQSREANSRHSDGKLYRMVSFDSALFQCCNILGEDR